VERIASFEVRIWPVFALLAFYLLILGPYFGESAETTQPSATDMSLAMQDVLEKLLAEMDEAAFSRSATDYQGPTDSAMDLEYHPDTNTLTWTHVNIGDYDMNGEVGIPDITPLARNYLALTSDGIGDDAYESWLDGDGDGEVNIPDITIIALFFNKTVKGYRIVTADEFDHTQPGPGPPVGYWPSGLKSGSVSGYYPWADETDFTSIGFVDLSEASSGIPPRFEVTLPEGALRYIAVQIEYESGAYGQIMIVIDFTE